MKIQDLIVNKPGDTVNASIHRANEHVELDDLDTLKSIYLYRQVLERLLLPT